MTGKVISVRLFSNRGHKLKSFMHRANNFIRPALTFISPVAGAIPVAGTPLKGSIEALLVVLNGIHVSQSVLETIFHV